MFSTESGETGLLKTVNSLAAVAAMGSTNPRVRSAFMLANLGLTVGNSVQSWIREYNANNSYVVKIADNDVLFNVLETWLIDNLPDSERKNLLVVSHDSTNSYGERSNNKPMSVYYNGDREQDIRIDGHTVKISIDRGPSGKSRRIPSEVMPMSVGSESVNISPEYIRIECKTIEAQKAVLNRLRKETERLTARKPVFRTATKWGDFRSNSPIPVRPIETVILKQGQTERILGDLKTFLSREEKYVQLGIPYHRGVLLHGDPGTGKTSIASAIAHELRLDVYYLSLSSIQDDGALTDLLSAVKERSVLLLEDVDVAHAAKDRDDSEGGITLSGLLNALDGFVTPHGLITIMTTNHLEVLDPALVRPGRIDILEEINAVDSYQVKNLCKQFLGFVPSNIPTIEVSDNLVAAQIIEVFKRHIDDKQAAASELVSLLERIKNVTQESVNT